MKTFFKYVISVILSVSIVLFFFLELFSSSFLSKNYLIGKLEENDYYTKIYEQVKTNFENYIYQSGLEEDVLDIIIDEEKIKKDTLKIIENVYDNLNNKIDTQEIKDKLEDKIRETLGNRSIGESQKKAIDTFIEHICNEYKNTIFAFGNGTQISNKVAETLVKTKLMKKIILIIIGSGFILLFVLNLKRIYKFFIYIGIALNISGLILLVINFYINIKIKVNNIEILNDATTELLRDILSEIITFINKTGIIIMVSGIIFIVLSNLVHNARLYIINKNTDEENI